jgi:hypothetical protein
MFGRGYRERRFAGQALCRACKLAGRRLAIGTALRGTPRRSLKDLAPRLKLLLGTNVGDDAKDD